jgi:hypothetical protein
VAQIAAPNPGTFPLTVTNPNPGSASAIPLSMKVGPGLVVFTLEPNSGTDVRVSNMLNIGLMVNGTDNPAVTLQVNGVAGGNGVVGTAISNTDGSITYTAPPVVPTPSNIVQLTITSVDNPAVRFSAPPRRWPSIPGPRPSCSRARNSLPARRCLSMDRRCQPPSTAARN